MLDQHDNKTIEIKLKEQYVATPSDNGICYIDTAGFKLINGFGDEIIDTAMSNGLLTYKFRVGTPNPTPPYLKTLQIISTTLDGNDGELTKQALVTGIRAKQNTFTTVLPERPTMVLRDPPGDGSYSFPGKTREILPKISFSSETSNGGGISVIIDVGPDLDIGPFIGVPDVEFTSNIGPTITALNTITQITNNSMEVCTSVDQRLSTSDDELVVGGHQGGDVFVGGGLNVEFGFADIVEFDSTTCMGKDSITVLVVPGNYATTFMYSEWNIENNVIRYLQDLANNATDSAELSTYVNSITQWNKILSDNEKQKAAAKFERNISFDAGVVYEYSETSDTSSTTGSTTLETTVLDVDLSYQAYILGIGGGVIVKATYEDITGKSEDGMTEKGLPPDMSSKTMTRRMPLR
ncbi:MAG: hypothetical protein IPH31_25120 [Lewinellaceae bacterium]|nr:hypothetical protein [Lewinellaceae bacterium]